MDSIEKGARERQGNFVYNLIWKARKGDQKWLWGVVAFIATLKLVLLPMIVMTLTWYVVSLNENISFGSKVFIGFWPAVLVSGILSPVLHVIFSTKMAFANTSNFIAIAGDMNRIATSTDNALVKLIAKVSYLAAGFVALYCAISIWLVRRNNLKSLSVTELDVLGNALSKGKRWSAARGIFSEMSTHFAGRFQEGEDAMQIAVSFALACKWMLGDPAAEAGTKNIRKSMIRQIMADYPDLPEEVTMRLFEAVGKESPPLVSYPIERIRDRG